MSPLATYRFLPWSRRGLAGEIQAADPLSGALPSARGAIRVTVAINANPAINAPNVETYGPGDVIGLDTRVIARTEPQPYTPDFEPNYVAAIDFDPPDFPWMLTPAAPRIASGVHKLRPWIVLLVFDRSRVELPKVERGRPLPTIQIPSAVVAEELPDLSESWAWAHVQVAMGAGDTQPVADHLAAHPDLNVSRLICPRRLAPMRQYFACLVPAFDQGVLRGLGGTPDPAAPLNPAWSISQPADLQLPVFYHWEFSTGPGGDFEELARRLRPALPAPTIGYQKAFLNPGELGVDGIGADREDAYVWIEGALQAPPVQGAAAAAAGAPGAALSTIPAEIRDRLRERLNEPAAIAAGLPAEAAQPIGPPIYGSWPAGEHALPQGSTGWLRELNLDPRFRAAAGIGAEVVRRNQEDFAQACWEQVADVLKANELLSRARLAQDIGDRLFARFFRLRPADHLVSLLAPIHARIPYRQTTIERVIRQSSVPDRAFDPALRRLASPQRPAIKRALQRAGVAAGPTGIATTLNGNRADVDPTMAMPDGVVGSRAIARAGSAVGRGLDFAAAGLNASLDATAAAALVKSARAAAAFGGKEFAPVQLDPQIENTGIVLTEHVGRLVNPAGAVAQRPPSLLVHDALSLVRAAGAATPAASALLVEVESGKPAVRALFVEADGAISTEIKRGERVSIGRLDPTLRGLSPAEAGALIAQLEPGSMTSRVPRGEIPIIRRTPRTVAHVDRVRAGEAPEWTSTTSPAIKDRATIDRYKAAFERYRKDHGVTTAPPKRAFVAVGFDDMRQTLLARTDPRTTIPARVRTMLSIGNRPFTDASGSGIIVSPAADRIMAGPKIASPMYEYLAAYDGERFLPGLGQVPQNSIVLLVPNTRFVEAFLVGMNHEMNRELLWRNYPTDQRGTIFQRFWEWADGGVDIPEVHTWPSARALGKTARQLAGGTQVVMLVRGELLRRYPGTVALAWPGEQRDGRLQLKVDVAAGEVLTPVFSGRFAPDFTFFGFALTPADVANGNWFFVLQQQAVEPRFGFDTPASDTSPALTTWLDATWDDVGTAEGAYLRLDGNPAAGRTLGGVTFGRDAGHLAAVLLQRPFRAALDAKKLLARMV